MIQEDPQFCENSKAWYWARKWECIISNRNKQKQNRPCLGTLLGILCGGRDQRQQAGNPSYFDKGSHLFPVFFSHAPLHPIAGFFPRWLPFHHTYLGWLCPLHGFQGCRCLLSFPCSRAVYLAPPSYPRVFNCHKQDAFIHNSDLLLYYRMAAVFLILPFSFHFLRFQGPSVLPLTFWICWIHLSYLCPFSLYTGIQWNRSEQGCQGVVQIGPKCTQLIQVEPGSKFLWFTQGILWVRDGCGTGHFAKNHAWEHWFSVLQIPSVTRDTLALCPSP